MTEVKASPLKVGDTFPTKDRLLLRIVEEANLYGVQMAIKRSDTFQVDTHVDGTEIHFMFMELLGRTLVGRLQCVLWA